MINMVDLNDGPNDGFHATNDAAYHNLISPGVPLTDLARQVRGSAPVHFMQRHAVGKTKPTPILTNRAFPSRFSAVLFAATIRIDRMIITQTEGSLLLGPPDTSLQHDTSQSAFSLSLSLSLSP